MNIETQKLFLLTVLITIANFLVILFTQELDSLYARISNFLILALWYYTVIKIRRERQGK